MPSALEYMSPMAISADFSHSQFNFWLYYIGNFHPPNHLFVLQENCHVAEKKVDELEKVLASNADIMKELQQSKAALTEKLSNGETQWKSTESQLAEAQKKAVGKDATLAEMQTKLQTQVSSGDFPSQLFSRFFDCKWFRIHVTGLRSFFTLPQQLAHLTRTNSAVGSSKQPCDHQHKRIHKDIVHFSGFGI